MDDPLIEKVREVANELGLSITLDPKPCPDCKHFACVCKVINEHKQDCKFRIATAGSVAIECDHGYDVCPICDPCTCKPKEQS